MKGLPAIDRKRMTKKKRLEGGPWSFLKQKSLVYLSWFQQDRFTNFKLANWSYPTEKKVIETMISPSKTYIIYIYIDRSTDQRLNFPHGTIIKSSKTLRSKPGVGSTTPGGTSQSYGQWGGHQEGGEWPLGRVSLVKVVLLAEFCPKTSKKFVS